MARRTLFDAVGGGFGRGLKTGFKWGGFAGAAAGGLGVGAAVGLATAPFLGPFAIIPALIAGTAGALGGGIIGGVLGAAISAPVSAMVGVPIWAGGVAKSALGLRGPEKEQVQGYDYGYEQEGKGFSPAQQMQHGLDRGLNMTNGVIGLATTALAVKALGGKLGFFGGGKGEAESLHQQNKGFLSGLLGGKEGPLDSIKGQDGKYRFDINDLSIEQCQALVKEGESIKGQMNGLLKDSKNINAQTQLRNMLTEPSQYGELSAAGLVGALDRIKAQEKVLTENAKGAAKEAKIHQKETVAQMKHENEAMMRIARNSQQLSPDELAEVSSRVNARNEAAGISSKVQEAVKASGADADLRNNAHYVGPADNARSGPATGKVPAMDPRQV